MSRRFVRRHRIRFPDIAMRIPYLTLADLLAFVSDVRQPTLVVATEHDTLAPISQMRALYRALPGKRFWLFLRVFTT